MKVTDIQVWEAFLGVVQYGNFSKASRSLGIPVPQLSKRVARLEEGLGVRLLQRSTRSVNLTGEGAALVPKLESLLSDLKALESSFDGESQISGVVKITSVDYLAHRFILPNLKAFKAKYPDIELEINLTTRKVQLIEEGYDLALRIETPKDSDLIYKKLLPNELILTASPGYLKKFGLPKTKQDLKEHELLMLDLHKNCEFKTGEILSKFLGKRSLKSDNANFLRELALNDHGILLRARWDLVKELQGGKLLEILKKEPLTEFGQIYAVIPSRKYLAPRVRVVFDWFQKLMTTD